MKKIQHIMPIILYFSLIPSTYCSSSDQQQTSKSFSAWLTWPTISIVTLAVAAPILGVKCWLNYKELDNAKYRSDQAKLAAKKIIEHKHTLVSSISQQKKSSSYNDAITDVQRYCYSFMPQSDPLAESTAFCGRFNKCYEEQDAEAFEQAYDALPLMAHIQDAQNDHRNYSRAAWAYGTCATLSALGIGGIALGRVKGWIKP